MINLKFLHRLILLVPGLVSCTATGIYGPSMAAGTTSDSPAPPLYLTAREAYDQALPLIAAWQPEARLFYLQTYWPSPGGRSPEWQLYFVDADAQMRVVKAEMRLNVQLPPADPQQHLPTCWLDSDDILRRLQDLSQSKQAIYSMSLHSNGQWKVVQGDQHWHLSACAGLLANKPEPDLL